MKQLSIILTLFFFTCIKTQATNYYISPTGNDANNGSISSPWRTLFHATSVAVASGDIINVTAGNYTETQICNVALGVSIIGMDTSSCVITSTYTGGGSTGAAIRLFSPTDGTNGNQTIAFITLKSTYPASDDAQRGILVQGRSNVKIHDISVHDFLGDGVWFQGANNFGPACPTTFATGNELYNFSIYNNSDRATGTGNLVFTGFQGMLVHDGILSQTQRPLGHNGDNVVIPAVSPGGFSCVSGLHFYRVKSYKNADDGASVDFSFHMELWDAQGGMEIDSCEFHGGAQQIDLAGTDTSGRSYNLHAPYTYNWYIHDNLFQWDTQLSAAPGSYTPLGVDIEADKQYITIANNYFKNVGYPITLSQNHDFILGQKNITISQNVFENSGFTNRDFAFDISVIGAGLGSKVTNLDILNNTHANTKTEAIYYFLTGAGDRISNVRLINNIAQGATSGYGWLTFDGSTGTKDSFYVQNNLRYQNVFTDNIFYRGGATAPTHFTNTGNIVGNPLFVNSSNDFHLTATSPARGAGIDVGFGTDIGAYPYGTKTTPTITWANPADITYNTLLSGTQLNATFGGVAGVAVYTPSAGTKLNAGSNQRLIVVFTPTDQTIYNVVADTVYINVLQATATLSASGLSVPFNNSPQQPVITTSPAGLTGVSTLYNGVGQIPTNAATYSCTSGLNNSNYTATPINYNFTITPLPGTFTASNQTFQYDSLLHTVTVSTSNPQITYTVFNGTQRYKGTYNVTFHNTNTNFNVPDLSITLTITAGIAPPLVWNPANMTYPAVIGNPQTNATDAKTGTYNYTPTTGFVPSAGSLQLKVDFTPSDTNLAPIIGTTRTITVAKRTDVITVTDTTQFADGTPKTISASSLYGGTLTITGGTGTAVGDYPYTVTYSDPNNQASPVSGTLHIISNSGTIFITNYSNRTYIGSQIIPTVTCPYSYVITYNGSSTAPSIVGSYTTIATINDGIHNGADTVTMTIIKATPTGTWAAISNQTYIYTVQSGILNASTATAGTWAYNVNVGDTLIPGTYNLIGTFTPTDGSNYNSITLNNSITINKGSAIISITNQSKQYNGQVQYATVQTSPANLDSLVVTYTGNHKDVGSYPISAQLFSNLYTASTVTGTLTISQGNYILTWGTPVAIQQNSPLNYALPTSSIAGTFTYNYPNGYVVQNNLTLIATFHPTDTNYPVQTISVFQSVYGNPLLDFYIRNGHVIYLNLPQ